MTSDRLRLACSAVAALLALAGCSSPPPARSPTALELLGARDDMPLADSQFADPAHAAAGHGTLEMPHLHGLTVVTVPAGQPRPGGPAVALAAAEAVEPVAPGSSHTVPASVSPGVATDTAAAPPLLLPKADDRNAATGLQLSPGGMPLQLRLGHEVTIERRRNFDLNNARDRDRRVFDQETKLEARLQPHARLMLMAEAVLLNESRHQPATATRTRNEAFQRGQLWLLVDRPGGIPAALQIGRLALADRRAWWWEDDLDAVRLITTGERWRAETGLAKEIARKASTDDGIAIAHRGVWRWFGQAQWDWQPRQRLEAFWLLALDRSGTPTAGSRWRDADVDPSDARLMWAGVRATGRRNLAEAGATGGGLRLDYWADLALLRGRDTVTRFSAGTGGQQVAGSSRSHPVRGHALDVGATLQWQVGAWRPTATVGWAQGSGGAAATSDGQVDRHFRQTGLHENKVRLSGVKRLARYGLLLDPELSNLSVATLGVGVQWQQVWSAELAWHQYRQATAATTLPGTRLSQLPAGLSPAIGHELDALLAWRGSPHLTLTLGLSRFTPGAAFADNRQDPAYGVELGIDLSF